jgi:hypothetical protein
MNRSGKYFGGLLALMMLVGGGRAFAEPYLAVRYGLKCTTCHVNPTGGGLRSDFGDVFAQTQLPAHPLHTPWGLWTGEVTNWLRLGGDLRYDANWTQTPHSPTTHQLAVQQGRLYGEAQVVPNRLIFYADAQVTPGVAKDHEAYAIFWSAAHDWYIKGGKMYLPFGFRLEDQTAFVYDVSGTSMYEPDNGIEFGWMRGHWDTQLTVSEGNFAGGLPSGSGKQYGLQASYVESRWRAGIAANDDDASFARRRILGVFGGVRTGPVEWLGEVDTVEFKSEPAQTQAAALLEADWLIAAGNNLKVTYEPYDPDRDVVGNRLSRWSLVYELTPVQFVQIRAGVRDYNGPRGVYAENQTLTFVQLHVFF